MFDIEQEARALRHYARHNEDVKGRDRAWRAKERAANVKPVSTKIAFYSPKVDATPAVKPRGRGK